MLPSSPDAGATDGPSSSAELEVAPGRSKLRVLHLVAPAAVGGLESVLRIVTAGLHRRGHDVRVLAVAEPGQPLGPFREPLERAGVPVEVLRLPARAYLREILKLMLRCRRLRPDVLHSHGFRSDVVAAVVGRTLGLPLVTTVHGTTGGSWKVRVYEWVQRLAFHVFDVVAVVSRPLADHLTGKGVPEASVRLLPNAFESDGEPLERDRARETLGAPPSGFLVGWVGRLSREKGPDVCVDALARLDGIPWRASIVGSGPLREALEERTEALGIDARLRFHGRVPRAGPLFRAFDVFVLSSRTEGTPIVLFEAIDAGVPVVATRVGGVPDVVGPEEAVLVPPEDPGALAGGVREVLQEPDRARDRAERARERMRSEYDVESWLDRHEAVYRRARATRHERRGVLP